jgi:hypothetical protein
VSLSQGGYASWTSSGSIRMTTPAPFRRRMSPRSSAGWRTFSRQQGVTQSALAESLGRAFAQTGEGERTPSWAAIIASARQVSVNGVSDRGQVPVAVHCHGDRAMAHSTTGRGLDAGGRETPTNDAKG